MLPWCARFVALPLVLLACATTASPSPSSTPPLTPAPSTKGAVVGELAPRFSVARVPGPGRVELVTGKVNLVMFFATWHAPSKQAFPRLEKLLAEYAGKPFALETLAVDEDDHQLPAWSRELAPKVDIGWDEAHRITEAWRFSTFPTFYVVDRAGRVRHIEYGYHDGDTIEALKQQINAAL